MPNETVGTAIRYAIEDLQRCGYDGTAEELEKAEEILKRAFAVSVKGPHGGCGFVIRPLDEKLDQEAPDA